MELIEISRDVIGQRIREKRRAKNLTQSQLATQCGFDYPIISNLERGQQSVHAERLGYIAQVLEVSTDYLLGLSDEEKHACPSHRK
jgi:transcriptional regulator with XRE-family HTH domain